MAFHNSSDLKCLAPGAKNVETIFRAKVCITDNVNHTCRPSPHLWHSHSIGQCLSLWPSLFHNLVTPLEQVHATSSSQQLHSLESSLSTSSYRRQEENLKKKLEIYLPIIQSTCHQIELRTKKHHTFAFLPITVPQKVF